MAVSLAHRKELYIEASQAAATVRHQYAIDPFAPLCIYDVCERMGVTVRFSAVSMEGMYEHSKKPRIHLSSLRPFGRRSFTCAHELGHHFFAHGTTVDRLQEDAAIAAFSDEEVLANSFAANLLMPIPGIRLALRRRGISAEEATATQLYGVACNFGIGFRTLIEHLRFTASALTDEAASRLRRWSPKAIRSVLLPENETSPLRLVDLHWTGVPVDAEHGDLLLCPHDAVASGDCLTSVSQTNDYHLFRCEKVGLGSLCFPSQGSTHFVRVQPFRYVGLARFRHLEDVA